jgi:AraC-like DNA-binding protein
MRIMESFNVPRKTLNFLLTAQNLNITETTVTPKFRVNTSPNMHKFVNILVPCDDKDSK